MDFTALKTQAPTSPAFIVDEAELLRSLQILSVLRGQCGVKVLYSIKSLPLTTVLAIAKPWVDGFSVSSLFEAQLAKTVLGNEGSIHLTTPGIRFDELEAVIANTSHISFNSLSQLQRFQESRCTAPVSVGLRINPKLSYLDDDRYNPCRPHSKLGASIDEVWQSPALEQINGLHIHTVFGAGNYQPLIKTVEKLRTYFGKHLEHLQWLNLGGGYLFNQIADHRPFIELVKQLQGDFGIEVIIEPGKAVVGDAGMLLATVIDRFTSDGKTLVVLDTSVNHQPEVFEYQYQFQPELANHDPQGPYSAVLVGGTCLAGDLFGEYRFKTPPAIGDKMLFVKIGAYSLVKANRFNGLNLPDIYLLKNNRLHLLKQYRFEDYRQQWQMDQ